MHSCEILINFFDCDSDAEVAKSEELPFVALMFKNVNFILDHGFFSFHPTVPKDVRWHGWLLIICYSLAIIHGFIADQKMVIDRNILNLSLKVVHRLFSADGLRNEATVLTAMETRISMVAPAVMLLVVGVTILRIDRLRELELLASVSWRFNYGIFLSFQVVISNLPLTALLCLVL